MSQPPGRIRTTPGSIDMPGLLALSPAGLVNGTAATAAVSTFIFNAATHVLSWDEDGTGGIAAIDGAVLQGVTSLTAANFELM